MPESGNETTSQIYFLSIETVTKVHSSLFVLVKIKTTSHPTVNNKGNWSLIYNIDLGLRENFKGMLPKCKMTFKFSILYILDALYAICKIWLGFYKKYQATLKG